MKKVINIYICFWTAAVMSCGGGSKEEPVTVSCHTYSRTDAGCDCLTYDIGDIKNAGNGVWLGKNTGHGGVVIYMFAAEESADFTYCELDGDGIQMVLGDREVQCGFSDGSDSEYAVALHVLLIKSLAATMDGWDRNDSLEGPCRATWLGAVRAGFVSGRLYAKSVSPFGWRADGETRPGPYLYYDDRFGKWYLCSNGTGEDVYADMAEYERAEDPDYIDVGNCLRMERVADDPSQVDADSLLGVER